MRPGTNTVGNFKTSWPSSHNFTNKKDSAMAVTPSKDYKRREREQRKLDKRMAREATKMQEFETQQLAAEAAAEEAAKQSVIDDQAKLEAEFEAELEAERQAQLVA